jgi:hypothetical protein
VIDLNAQPQPDATCPACRRGDGPLSLHHHDPGGCKTAGQYEQVDHPRHYQGVPGIECIDVIEHFPHNVGAAMKYLWRAGLKPGTDTVTDLRKSLWYVQREIERLERSGTAS